MANILVEIYTPQEYNHASYVHTGLFEMKAHGLIDVKVKLSVNKRLGTTRIQTNQLILEPKRAQPKTSYYQITDKTNNKSILIAIDLYDAANQFSTVALETCDIVFKRNFEQQFVNQLPKAQQKKMKRFGLSFPLSSKNRISVNKMLLGLLLNTIVLNTKKDKRLISCIQKSLKTNLSEWNYVKSSRPIANFDNFIQAKSNTILYQTRCFPHENDEDVSAIHKQRYGIIKHLNQNFPDDFKGGFMPSTISEKKYKDALTNVPTEQNLYIQAVKNAKVVIYTRGLANSPAWKLAEYLSQGKVIIAEKPTTDFPVPLVNGKELLYFNTLEELTELINQVLNDDALMKTLSHNARMYYENHIHPVKRMQYVINTVLESPIF